MSKEGYLQLKQVELEERLDKWEQKLYEQDMKMERYQRQFKNYDELLEKLEHIDDFEDMLIKQGGTVLKKVMGKKLVDVQKKIDKISESIVKKSKTFIEGELMDNVYDVLKQNNDGIIEFYATLLKKVFRMDENVSSMIMGMVGKLEKSGIVIDEECIDRGNAIVKKSIRKEYKEFKAELRGKIANHTEKHCDHLITELISGE